MPELPLDVIYNNILPRLPVKSLIRFKTVSKQWHSFLKSQIFANMHLNRVTNDDHQNHYKFLKISSQGPNQFCTIDCETLEEVGACRPFPFEVHGRCIRFESSCNGLVFLCIRNDDDDMISDLIIWNPLTSDYKSLAKTDINEGLYNLSGRVVFELYYNSCDEDYKLVCVSYNHDVYIYSMKSDSWRKVNANDACQFEPDLISSRVYESTCLEENLYFVGIENMITKFDTKTEKFTKILTPFSGDWQFWSPPMVQGGYIYLCVKSYSPCSSYIKLWRMKRDGKWTRVSTYYDELWYYPFRQPQPLHLMRDGNWLMKSRHDGNLYKVDMENKHKGEASEYTLKGIEERRYIPTFLSPNQYMN